MGSGRDQACAPHLLGGIAGSFQPSGDLGEACADRGLNQRLKLGSSEGDGSRLVERTAEQEGKIAAGDRATGLGCGSVSKQLDLACLQGDLAARQIENDVPHKPKT